MEDFEGSVKECIRLEDVDKLEKLLKGVKLKAPLKSGWTPLHHASYLGKHTIVNFLLEKGAGVNDHFEFFTPLMAVCSDLYMCSEDERMECAQYLLQHKADINAMDKCKITALMLACSKGLEKLVSLLLQANCDVNKSDNDGMTALHMACMYNHPQCVKLLLEYGADKNMKDRRGRTPLALATAKGSDEIISMLDNSETNRSSDFDAHTCYQRKKSSFEELLAQLPGHSNSSVKDGFYSDVEILLSGVGMGNRADLFTSKGISLAQYLNVKNNELKEIGVYFSSHREKIILGNKRFILRPWGVGSIREVDKNTDINIMDVVRSLANTVKHLHILWATSLYCYERVILPSDIKDLKLDDWHKIVNQSLRQTKALIKELIWLQERLGTLAKVDNVEPADHILPRKASSFFSFNKVFLIVTVCGLLLWKRNSIMTWK